MHCNYENQSTCSVDKQMKIAISIRLKQLFPKVLSGKQYFHKYQQAHNRIFVVGAGVHLILVGLQNKMKFQENCGRVQHCGQTRERITYIFTKLIYILKASAAAQIISYQHSDDKSKEISTMPATSRIYVQRVLLLGIYVFQDSGKDRQIDSNIPDTYIQYYNFSNIYYLLYTCVAGELIIHYQCTNELNITRMLCSSH